MQLYLYQRDECHLCDQALLALAQAGVAEFESVYIDGDAVLEQRYGLRVPVLSVQEGGRVDELDWPFGAGRLAAWLQARGGI